MESLVTVKNNSMLEAFNMLLAIQLNARETDQKRRVRVRKSTFNQKLLAHYRSEELETSPESVINHLVVEFHQYEGVARLYVPTPEQVEAYRPTELRKAFNYKQLFRENEPRIWSIDELPQAARAAGVYLSANKYEPIKVRDLNEYKRSMELAYAFMLLRGRDGRIPIELLDLGRLLGVRD